MTQILSYSEDGGLSLELANGAAQLAGSSGKGSSAVVLDALGEASPPGSVLLLRSDGRIAGDHELVGEALVAAGRAKDAAVYLIGATRLGRQVAAKIAVMTGLGVLSDVRDLRLTEDQLTGVRGVYAGKFNARVASALPCVALVPPGCYQPGAPGASSVEELKVGPLDTRVRHLEVKPKTRGSVDLKAAEIIVAAGRGFKKKEDLALAESLASSLGGELGASRPLSSDLGWLGEERHIGLTGIYVRPKLYVAVGISGQLQHVAGIKDSQVIVAINKDRQAPIFQVADYGIVGDLYQILPELIRALTT